MKKKTINNFLDEIKYFASLNSSELNSLLDCFEEIELKPGEMILRKGDKHSALFYINRGEVKIFNERPNAEPVEIDTIHDGAFFGEEFLFPGKKVKFSYSCAAPQTSLFKLSYAGLLEFFEANRLSEQKIKDQISFNLLKNFINSGASYYDINGTRLLEIVKENTPEIFTGGSVITEAKEKDERVYVLLEGIAEESNLIASASLGKKFYGGDILGKVTAGIGKDLKSELKALTDCRLLAIKKLDLMLFLFDQEGFEESLDKIIEEKQPGAPAEETAEKKQADEWEADAEIPDYDYKVPLKHRLGFYPAIRQQSQMDCGAACLVNLCKYYGKNVSMNRMRDLTRVGRSGASMFNILSAAKKLGFHSIPLLSTYEDLAKLKNPAIVNWKGYHWIVVYKADDKKVVVADPAQGKITYSKKDFIAGWTRYTLAIYPGSEIRNIEESKPSLKQFASYFKPFKKNIREILLASLCLQVFNIFLPLFTKFMLDNVIIGEKQDLLLIAITVISAITLLIAGLGYLRQRLLLYVSLRANTRMIGDFFRQMLNLPLRFFEARKTGDLTTRFQENEKITDFMTNTGLQIFLDLFSAVLYLGLMFYLNINLSIIITIFIGLQLFIYYFITPRIKQAFREVFERNAESESFLIESLKGISTIKAIGIENPTRWKWENLQMRSINTYFKTIKYGMVTGLSTGLVNHLSDVAVLFYGAVLVLDNQLTIGSLIAFTVMAKGVAQPITQLASSWNIFQEALNSVERLNDVLESHPEVEIDDEKNKYQLPALRGYMRMDNLTFRYEQDSKDNVLQNISLDIEPGQRIAFVGRSGSGKSTLIKLIYGFYKPTSGQIFADGFALGDVYLPSLRNQIGLVPQENDLFKGSIRENIAKSKPASGLAEIIEAAKLAGAHEFISSFPDGYNTMLEERGANISGGQRQRIAIARTFIQKPKILILDEATSALDNESERKIQNNLENHLAGTTIIMIAHRLSTIQNSDQIFVIDKGNIIEKGNHQQLLANRGLYYYLANQQLSL